MASVAPIGASADKTPKPKDRLEKSETQSAHRQRLTPSRDCARWKLYLSFSNTNLRIRIVNSQEIPRDKSFGVFVLMRHWGRK